MRTVKNSSIGCLGSLFFNWVPGVFVLISNCRRISKQPSPGRIELFWSARKVCIAERGLIGTFFRSEIVDGVRNGPDQVGTPLRPLIDENACDDDVARLMKQCWAEDPADRPDFTALKNTIRKLNK